jgi:hypothetical protein
MPIANARDWFELTTNSVTTTTTGGSTIRWATGTGSATTVNNDDSLWRIYTTDTTGGTISTYVTSSTTAANTIVIPYDGTYTTVGDNNYIYYGVTPSAADMKKSMHMMVRDRMRRNMMVKMGRSRTFSKDTPQELRAQTLLRDMISEAEWRRYVTNGFLMVKGASGRWYQVFRDGRHIQVFERGQRIASICIHSDQKCPPSDHVINMKVLIEIDEEEVWKGGNVHRRDAGFVTLGNVDSSQLVVGGDAESAKTLPEYLQKLRGQFGLSLAA